MDIEAKNTTFNDSILLLDDDAPPTNGRWDAFSFRSLSSLPPPVLTSMAAFILSIAFVGSVGNLLTYAIFRKVPSLRSLPMQPLVQASLSVQFVECSLVQSMHAGFLLAVEMPPPARWFFCTFQYGVHSFCLATVLWTISAVVAMRVCLVRGYSVYFRNKKRIVSVFCIVAILAGMLDGVFGIVAVGFGDDESRSTIGRRSVAIRGGDGVFMIVDRILLGFPIVLTAFLALISRSATCNGGGCPIPIDRRRIFNAYNLAFVLMLLSHGPLFLAMLLDGCVSLPRFVHPWSILLSSLGGLWNFVSLLICDPKVRFAGRQLLRGSSWSEIETCLEKKPRRKFVGIRRVQFRFEHYRFIEEHL